MKHSKSLRHLSTWISCLYVRLVLLNILYFRLSCSCSVPRLHLGRATTQGSIPSVSGEENLGMPCKHAASNL
ncbi:hypothetical protein BDW02DRAFT_551206, partial [Decorospora gaudefroyi]